MASRIFTDELHPATAMDCQARWSGGRPGELFKCGFCGHKFVEGDLYRGLYTNDIQGGHGNPLVCEKCNLPTPQLRDKWLAKHKEWQEYVRTSFWWFHSLTLR